MALFTRKKTNTEEKSAEKKAAKPRAKKASVKKEVAVVDASPSANVRTEGRLLILRPHITEKATMLSEAEKHVYTFEVARNANKIEIKKAIKTLYNVTPIQIRIVNRASRHEQNGRTRRMVRHPGHKKAYVTLKKGEQISFI